MEKFKSVRVTGSEEERVNLTRLGRLLRKFEGRTGKINGLNVSFVQKALFLRDLERKTKAGLNLC